MPRVVRSALAADDLLQLWLHVGQHDVSAADRLLDRIEALCFSLAASPLIGRSREEIAAGLRSYPIGRYVLFYRPVRGGIEVARVLHGARDLDSLF